MNYIEILARQEELAKEMDELQQARVQCAKNKESLSTDQKLTSGKYIAIELAYNTGYRDIFTLEDGEGTTLTFTVEDYNEISQFFSKYNDAIFSYMSEITKDDADVSETTD
jgi:uncharacterized membrane protein YfhO